MQKDVKDIGKTGVSAHKCIYNHDVVDATPDISYHALMHERSHNVCRRLYDTVIIGGSVSGLSSAGDITRMTHTLTFACADGEMAALAIHRSLLFGV